MSMTTRPGTKLFGVVAEFQEHEVLVAAARAVTEAGYRKVEAYSPYPVEHLAESLNFHRTRLPLIVLCGGVLGGVAGYGLQYWVSVIQYPLNIGGRPPHSWPLFLPVTFECIVLVAALSCVLGMLALNGLPRPYHPLFDVEGFERASSDRFFLCILATDEQFDAEQSSQFLEGLDAERVSHVYQ
jgi:hypothetical protein